jgi:hypothetical protein
VLEHDIVSQRSTRQGKLAGHKDDDTPQEILTKQKSQESTNKGSQSQQAGHDQKKTKVSVSNSIIALTALGNGSIS